MSDLFSFAGNVSRFWLPPLLDNLAGVVPTLCNGDGCSIFLKDRGRLSLAATTRDGLHARLFDDGVSYNLDADEIREAKDRSSTGAGLTGWVAEFDRVLNLADLKDDSEREGYADPANKIPAPYWSDRARGFMDWDGPRPLLIAPMRRGGDYLEDNDKANEVLGAIRVYRVQEEAKPFNREEVNNLLEFGNKLADFLESRELLESGIHHYFRIWAAPEADVLAERLTKAVPDLFEGVDTCSLFLRDRSGSFVLRNAHAKGLDPESQKYFDNFKQNINDISYKANEDSKTGYCIENKRTLFLVRNEDRNWVPVEDGVKAESDTPTPTFTEDGTAFLATGSVSKAKCELDPAKSEVLLLVPVRDRINFRSLAGVIRMVSLKRGTIDADTLKEMNHFADGLGRRIARTQRKKIERDSGQKLIRELQKLSTVDDRWSRTAVLVAEAIEADAATVFVLDGNELISFPSYSHLNIAQIRQDAVGTSVDQESRHAVFKKDIGNLRYPRGQGKTGKALDRTVKIRNMKDEEELREWDIQAFYANEKCEINDAKAFIATPVVLSPGTTGTAVIRAVRSAQNPRGFFSIAHEEILETCARVVADLHTVTAFKEQRVVISYDHGLSRPKMKLERLFRALGIVPLVLNGYEDDWLPKFKSLVTQAGAGICICDEVGKNQMEELILFGQSPSLEKRLFVFHRSRAAVPSIGGQVKKSWELQGDSKDNLSGSSIIELLEELSKIFRALGTD